MQTDNDGRVLLYGYRFSLTINPVGDVEIETNDPTPAWVLRDLLDTLDVEWAKASKKTLDWMTGREE